MAYMSQENKKEKAPKLREVFKKYGVKASIAVRNHSTLVVNVKSGPIDFISNYNAIAATRQPDCYYAKDHLDVNPYHYKTQYSNEALDFLHDVMEIMLEGNHDNSDIMTDYFDVGWYNDINIGQWNKPYILTKEETV